MICEHVKTKIFLGNEMVTASDKLNDWVSESGNITIYDMEFQMGTGMQHGIYIVYSEDVEENSDKNNSDVVDIMNYLFGGNDDQD